MPATRAAVLRAALNVARPAVAMAAHSPLSARLAEEAGFEAIWASGFELSALNAVPDANILSLGTQLENVRAMAAAARIPVVADIDTGFGNAVNVHYLVPQFVAAGAAAVVMEDKTFPKDSSLRPGGRQHLVPVAEFQGKIAAACDARGAAGTLVVARTEALIAGLGEAEALARGEAYAAAGADAVLIHSKQKTPDEIVSFCRAWSGRVPLVLVPTSYPQLDEAAIGALGKVGLVICGNHAIRAAVAAMRGCFARIRAERSIAGVDGEIASVQEVFDLQGDAAVRDVERRFLR
jgi:phosphoenolpyruvate phosphomutase